MGRRAQVVVCRIVGVALLAGITAQTSLGAQASPDAEFQKIADAFSAAWNKGDAKGIAALHTKDAIRLGGNGQPPVVGTAAIEAALSIALTGPLKGTTLTIKSNQFKRVSPDTYVGDGTYALAGGSPPAGTSTQGHYMNVLVREGGRWLIAAASVMPITPPK
jgi:uncharacterized protein (TIGR02246 family)